MRLWFKCNCLGEIIFKAFVKIENIKVKIETTLEKKKKKNPTQSKEGFIIHHLDFVDYTSSYFHLSTSGGDGD